jgi:hypothetical protein
MTPILCPVPIEIELFGYRLIIQVSVFHLVGIAGLMQITEGPAFVPALSLPFRSSHAGASWIAIKIVQ